ncbi:MAG: hypothetical protein RLZZ494_1752 [Pseudomonadota bacterium]|jgi:hypothetical protein
MMKRFHLWVAALLCAALGLLPAAYAGEGHDHGEAPAAAASPTLPRLTASSEAFELVGVLQGHQLTLYLDRADDNRPVEQARIELELGATKVVAQAHDNATFVVTLPQEPPPGVLPVTATVTVGDEVDLLAGELDIHAEAAEVHTETGSILSFWVIGGSAGVLGLGLLGWAWRRRAAMRSSTLS